MHQNCNGNKKLRTVETIATGVEAIASSNKKLRVEYMSLREILFPKARQRGSSWPGLPRQLSMVEKLGAGTLVKKCLSSEWAGDQHIFSLK